MPPPPGDDSYQLHPSVDGAFCWGIDNGHLNGGTKLDLAIALQNTDQVSVLLGIGDGTFQQPAPERGYLYSVEPPQDPPGQAISPIMVEVVDLNQDGFGDMVTTNEVTDNISVLINLMVTVIPP